MSRAVNEFIDSMVDTLGDEPLLCHCYLLDAMPAVLWFEDFYEESSNRISHLKPRCPWAALLESGVTTTAQEVILWVASEFSTCSLKWMNLWRLFLIGGVCLLAGHTGAFIFAFPGSLPLAKRIVLSNECCWIEDSSDFSDNLEPGIHSQMINHATFFGRVCWKVLGRPVRLPVRFAMPGDEHCHWLGPGQNVATHIVVRSTIFFVVRKICDSLISLGSLFWLPLGPPICIFVVSICNSPLCLPCSSFFGQVRSDGFRYETLAPGTSGTEPRDGPAWVPNAKHRTRRDEIPTPFDVNRGKEICEDLVEVWGLKIENGSDGLFLCIFLAFHWLNNWIPLSPGLLDISTTSRVPCLTPQSWEGQESLLRRTQLGWCSRTINHESCLSNCDKFEAFLLVGGKYLRKRCSFQQTVSTSWMIPNWSSQSLPFAVERRQDYVEITSDLDDSFAPGMWEARKLFVICNLPSLLILCELLFRFLGHWFWGGQIYVQKSVLPFPVNTILFSYNWVVPFFCFWPSMHMAQGCASYESWWEGRKMWTWQTL